jgi:hypothetical protein
MNHEAGELASEGCFGSDIEESDFSPSYASEKYV